MLGGVRFAMTFVNYYPNVCSVVVGFLVGFFYPACEVWTGCVFAFDADSAVVAVADVGDVAFVCCSGFDSPVYAVVEVVGEVVGDGAFEACSGVFG